MNKKEIKLNKAIMAHGEKLHVLELREPSYEEIESIGFPFTLSGGGAIKPDASAALKYIPLLAGIPRSSAASLDKMDIFKLSVSILGFFTSSETETDSGEDSTMSPTSGE